MPLRVAIFASLGLLAGCGTDTVSPANSVLASRQSTPQANEFVNSFIDVCLSDLPSGLGYWQELTAKKFVNLVSWWKPGETKIILPDEVYLDLWRSADRSTGAAIELGANKLYVEHADLGFVEEYERAYSCYFFSRKVDPETLGSALASALSENFPTRTFRVSQNDVTLDGEWQFPGEEDRYRIASLAYGSYFPEIGDRKFPDALSKELCSTPRSCSDETLLAILLEIEAVERF